MRLPGAQDKKSTHVYREKLYEAIVPKSSGSVR